VRIAVLGPSRHPVAEPFAGGQERFTADMVRGLRQRGHHLTVYARAGTADDLTDDLQVMPDLPPLSQIASGDPNMPEPDFLRDQFVYLAAVQHLLRRSDVDIVLNQSLHQLPLALAPALDVPIVTTLHTPPFPWMEIGAWLAGPAAQFVAVSAALRRMWSTLPEVSVIHNGVDEGGFPPGTGGPDLCWAGRLTPEKGADIAIRAARRAGRRLRLAGPISDTDWFDGVVRPELTAGRVDYLGPLRGGELAELYGTSAATVVTPRWEEPFCLVAAESLMCGTPVLGIARGGIGEVVAADCGRLVGASGDVVGDLVAALPAVDALDRAEIAVAARRRLSLGATVRRYEELLERTAYSAAGVA